MSRQQLARVALGTVQLGLPYGRNRGGSAPDERSAFAILNDAWSAGIRRFDTAEDYGSASPRLAEWLRCEGVTGEAHITTKISVAAACDSAAVAAAIAHFDGAASLTLLSHGALDAHHFAQLADVTRALGVPAGQSVYDANEVRAAAAAGATRVQAPASAVDPRQIEAAHEVGVAFDARSVFLQGMLLESPSAAEARVPGTGELVERVQQAAHSAGLSPLAALLNAAMALLDANDHVVLGVDDPRQLNELVAALDPPAARVGEFVDRLATLRIMDYEALFDPRSWGAS
jgi:aryl-alcohol dehydrogenase-like predicted oxidoreductase